VSWELSSPVLGAVLHKHLPRDTYTVYKSGGRLRIDGHLKGINDEASGLLPSWKFGHFSFLVDTVSTGEKWQPPVHVNHDRKTCTPLDVRPLPLLTHWRVDTVGALGATSPCCNNVRMVE
jgi:hypothetical protein